MSCGTSGFFLYAGGMVRDTLCKPPQGQNYVANDNTLSFVSKLPEGFWPACVAGCIA